MKNNVLKHCKRKKFFYRLFMRKSPRTGAMFGLAWMNMAIAFIPFFALALFQVMGRWNGFLPFFTIAFSAVLLYLYGMICCALGLERIFYQTYKVKKLCNFLGGVCAWIPPLTGVFLIPVLIQRKRWFGVLSALAGIVLYGISFYCSNTVFSVVFFASVCYLTALSLVQDKYRFSKIFMIPFGIAVLLNLFLFFWHVKLQMDVKYKHADLARLVGRSLNIDDLWDEDATGFSPDKEPLKTLIAKNSDGIDIDFDLHDSSAAKKKLLEINSQHAGFVSALEQFLTLPVHYVAHKKSDDGLLMGVNMPELNVLRNGARILLLKIAAEPENKQNVIKCNIELQKLRDWSLHNRFLLSYLVAVAIERIRINALRPVIARYGYYSSSELKELIGPEVEWNRFLRLAYGDEAICFRDSLNHLQNMAVSADLSTASPVLISLKKHLPLFISLHFLRDYDFALDNYIALCKLTDEELSALDKCRKGEFDEKSAQCNFFIVSSMLLPSLNSTIKHTASAMDIRKMALCAIGVMERKNDLSLMPEFPLAALDHQPLKFEKTNDGFRIYSHTADGKIPGEKDIAYYYQLHLKCDCK